MRVMLHLEVLSSVPLFTSYVQSFLKKWSPYLLNLEKLSQKEMFGSVPDIS